MQAVIVFLKLDFDLPHIICRNFWWNFLHYHSFWAKSRPQMMFSWNSILTSLNYKGHQNFGQQKPWADRTRSLHIFVLKGGGGGDAGFQVADENFPSWRGAWKRYAKGLPKTARTNLPCDILVDFRTKTGAGEALCAGVENKYRKLCGTYKFGPQPPSFKGK